MLRGVWFVCFMGVAQIVVAQGVAQESPAAMGKWEYSGYVSRTTISASSDAVRSGEIGDSALSIGVSADYDHGRFLSSLGFDYIAYDDKNDFSQYTRDTFGNEENTESNASALLLTLASGPIWRFADDSVFVYAQGGLGFVFASERSIPNCSDCAEQTIDMDGGLYAKAGVIKNVGSLALGLSYRKFVSGDGLDSSLAMSIHSAF